MSMSNFDRNIDDLLGIMIHFVIYCQTIYQKKFQIPTTTEETVRELASVRAFCHENQENHRNRSTCINHFL